MTTTTSRLPQHVDSTGVTVTGQELLVYLLGAMTTVRSACGGVERHVTVRRAESADAQQVQALVGPPTAALFGMLDVMRLLERANLAVTLADGRGQVVAHASFLDQPVGGVVAPERWESYLQQHFHAGGRFTPLNTLFLHLFVAQPRLAPACIREILRAVFHAVTELQYVCLVSPHLHAGDLVLEEVFEPLATLQGPPPCLALVSHRQQFCLRLHVRQARVEDYEDLLQMFPGQWEGPGDALLQVLDQQTPHTQAAVCESEGRVLGFMSVSCDVDVEVLDESFDLGAWGELYRPPPRPHPVGPQDNLAQPGEDRRGGLEDGARECTAPESQPEGPEGPESQPEGPEGPESQPEGPEGPESQPEGPEGPESQPEGPEGPESQPEGPEGPESQPEGPEGPESQPKGAEEPEQHNVFCIRMFVTNKDHETRSLDFLPYFFNLFPGRDLCVVSVPRQDPEGPLVQGFQRVPPRTPHPPTQELYLFHRTGLLRSVQVRRAVSADRAAVCDLVSGVKGHQSLLEDLDVFLQNRRAPDGTPVEAFVVRVEQQTVGVLVLRDEHDVEFLRAHYNIDSFIYFSQHGDREHGRLCHFALLPLFHRHAKHFLGEVLRLAHKTCLYLPVHAPLHQARQCVPSQVCLLGAMVPVPPRRQVVLALEELGPNAPSCRVTREQEAFGLSLLSRKLTLEPKVVLNARVVVVGASQTALAFLEVLSFCPHLRFNNLILVSPHGFPDDRVSHDDACFLSRSGPASRCSDSALLAVRACVTVVTGKMVSVRRQERRILLRGGGAVQYDHLILCTGLQYQVPRPTGEEVERPRSHAGPQSPRHHRYQGAPPPNLLTLNQEQDCQAARAWVCQEVLGTPGNAVVYGRGLDVYTCLETLLLMGVPGAQIHLVLTPSETCCFGDPRVGVAVGGALRAVGVVVHADCVLAQMTTDRTTGKISSVSFSSPGAPLLLLPCAVLLNLSGEGVDHDAFRSVQKAGLLFDGRLVVDAHTFLTNDPAVRAAGPLTKFSRRYRAAADQSHARYSSREVGQALAAAMLALFDPTVVDPRTGPPQPQDQNLVPEFSQAKVQVGRLPGGYHYLHVTKPSPLHSAPQHQGSEVVTGAAETGNYFRVHLDRYEVVDGLTCLSREPLPLSNYLCLYGRHRRLLKLRQGLTSDLYRWFREPWSLALFHDRLPDLLQEVQQNLAQQNLVQQNLAQRNLSPTPPPTDQDATPLTEKDRPLLVPQSGPLTSVTSVTSLRSSVFNYLSFNRSLLPWFAVPRRL